MEETANKRTDTGRVSFGIERRYVFAWLSALFMAAGAALIIIYYARGGEAGACFGGWRIPLLVILPVFAALTFTAELLVHGGDRLFKTGLPVLLGALYFVFRLIAIFREGGYVSAGLLAVLIVYCVLCVLVWELTGNAYRLKTKWVAVAVFALPVVLHLAAVEAPLYKGEVSFASHLWHLGSLCLLCAMVFAGLGLEEFTAEPFRPRRGDRCDGRLLRGLDPMNGVAIYIMPNRNGAATYFSDSFECENAEEYVRRKRDEGLDGFGLMHLIAAAYVRVVAQKPAVNRFISGQRIYTRDDEAELAMVVKKELTADAPETVIKVNFAPGDTPEEVYRKFSEQVQAAKDTPLDSGFDNLAGLINAVPGVFKKFLVWFLKTLDYFGCLPRFLLRLSPFHGSIFITALGSLGIPPVFHHLYDFGNIPIFVAFGARRTVTEIGPDGEPVRRKYMDYTIVSDERICDGFYYASAIKMFRRYLMHPEKLDTPLEEIVKDEY